MANSTFATALRLAIQPSGWQQKLCSNTYEKYQKCVGKALDKCSCAPVTHRLNQAIFGLICDKQNYLNLNKHQFCLTDAYIHGYVEDCSDQLVELEKHPMNGCEKADRFIQCLYGINSKTCGFGEVADILSSFSDSAISAKYGLNCRNITTNGPVASYDSTVSPSESSTATAAPAAPASTTKHARKHKTTTTAQPQEITTISSGNDSVTATTAGQLIQQNLTLSTNGDILNQTESTTATAETTTQQSHLETTVVSRRKHTGKPGRRRLTLATKATPKTEINDFPVNPELLRNKVDNNSQNISESSVVISTTLRPAEVSQPNAAEVSSKSEVLQSVTNSSSSLEEISTTPSNLNATVPSFTSGVAVSKAQDPVVNSRGGRPPLVEFVDNLNLNIK